MQMDAAGLVAEATRLNIEMGRLLDALRARLEEPLEPTNTPVKRGDGRLTDAGISQLYADFADGKLTGQQIAEKHGISLSGVIKRRSLWRRGVR
jgi:hypothetical protein